MFHPTSLAGQVSFLKPLQVICLRLCWDLGRAYATVQTHQHVFKVPREREALYLARKLNILRREMNSIPHEKYLDPGMLQGESQN